MQHSTALKADCYEGQEEFLTTPEAAAFLRAAVATMEGWRIKGGGPAFIKMGRRVVYRRSDLLAFALGNLRKSTSDAGASPAPKAHRAALDDGRRA